MLTRIIIRKKSATIVAILLLTTQLFFACDDSISDNNNKVEAKDSLSFLVLGDWGWQGEANQTPVAEQMAAYSDENSVDFVISVGDNFYPSGVESVSDSSWITSFENVYIFESLQIPWYIALGNHDYRGNVQAQIDYTDISDRWNLPARYYSLQKTICSDVIIEFIFLDTDPLRKEYSNDIQQPFPPDSPEQIQLEWFENTLMDSNADWKIVIAHHPVFSGGYHGSNPFMLDIIEPFLRSNNVQFVFSGHEHDLQHIDPENGTQYLVSGAGASTRNTEPIEHTVFCTDSTSGFMTIEISETVSHLQVIDQTGNVIHEASVDINGDLIQP